MRKSAWIVLGLCALGSACTAKAKEAAPASLTAPQPAKKTSKPLKSVEELSAMKDDEAKSLAAFAELRKVLTHPRCINCHPASERPNQGEESHPHQPLVVRGAGGMGATGMRCLGCHGQESALGVPGNPAWHLAPPEMAWEGLNASELCAQLLDPERNGGKSKDDIVKHIATDELVSYGWAPPEHLEPAPGDQKLAGEIARIWVDAGAHCP